jgi:hypothetical protein
MKKTIRARQENKPEPKAHQGKKPTIHGQNTATIGHRANGKSGYERKIIGAIRRLSETSDPVESLTIDEIKAAVRAVFPHLSLTDGDLDRYIADAKSPGENLIAMADSGVRNLAKSKYRRQNPDLIRKFRSLSPAEQAEMLDEFCLALNALLAEAEGRGGLNAKERLILAREFEGWAGKLTRSIPIGSKTKSIPRSGCRIFASDPELEEIIRQGDWDPQKRRSMAKTLMTWAEYLLATADCMDGKPLLSNLN